MILKEKENHGKISVEEVTEENIKNYLLTVFAINYIDSVESMSENN